MDVYDGATPVLDLDYTYDLAGNITGIADAGGGPRGRNYAYDELHRLTQGQELAPGGGSVALQSDYSYDAVGNRLTRDVSGQSPETYSYDTASSRLLSVLAGGVTRSFTYGASVNVTLDDMAGSAMTLTYDSADRPAQVSAGSTVLADYVYSATGQRAVKDIAGTATHYLHGPGGVLLAEADGATGGALREYIALGGATLAIVDASGVSYVHADRLTAPQILTDGATGAVVWDATYRPFGQVSSSGLSSNEQRFPGQYADAETGYYDNWHRTYDPALGRYLQSDPIGIEGGWNTYAYAGGNPVMRVDPEGGKALCITGTTSLIPGCNQLGLEGGMGPGRMIRSPGRGSIRGVNKPQICEVPARPDPRGLYPRPSGYRKGMREKVWQDFIEPATGRVRDPKTGQFMSSNKPWDMGHRPGYEFRKHQNSAADRGISRKQFLDEHNNPSHYRPELPSSNRCRSCENLSDSYYGPK